MFLLFIDTRAHQGAIIFRALSIGRAGSHRTYFPCSKVFTVNAVLFFCPKYWSFTGLEMGADRETGGEALQGATRNARTQRGTHRLQRDAA